MGSFHVLSSCAVWYVSPCRALQQAARSVNGWVLCRLTGFFKGLGVKAVLDTNTGRDIALLEAAAEFLERYKAAHPGFEQDGETITYRCASRMQVHLQSAQVLPEKGIV